MSDAFICRRGGIGTGCELTVNAPAGVTVTAVHSTTSKSYTKTANADGVAVFKGLPEGTYNITISDGTTTTEPVSVVASYKAETTVAFFQATINITYPAGSTCMCTCDDVSFTAPNTSGTWACIVPNAGTWTVGITDGVKTQSENVVIDNAGETKAVTLTYTLYLFDKGDTYFDITGGWTNTTTGGSTSGYVSDENLVWHAEVGGSGYYRTVYAIDITLYSTLYVNITSTTVTNSDRSHIVVWNEGNTEVASKNVPGTGILSIDVSSITGNVRIGAAYHSNMTTRANMFWLKS